MGVKPKILFIINSRSLAGLEKRFGYLFSYINNNPTLKNEFIIIINRILFEKLNDIYKYNNSHNISFVKYGFKKESFLNKINNYKYVGILDDILLLISVLKTKIKYKEFSIVHFINVRSLRSRWLFKNEKKITSFYNGGSTREGIKGQIYKKIFIGNFYIDCLSKDIKCIILNESENPPDSHRVFASPCSFINYENTNVDFREKENIISFVGRLNSDKGLAILIDILNKVFERIPSYKVYILGKGPLEKELNLFIVKNKLEKLVITDFIPDPKVLLKRSKIFLSLQKNENYPSQSLLESMACKNAVIATDVGLTRSIVNGDNGILINNNSTALLNALIELTNNENIIKTMGENGRAFVMKNHTVEKYYNYLDNVYNIMINS